MLYHCEIFKNLVYKCKTLAQRPACQGHTRSHALATQEPMSYQLQVSCPIYTGQKVGSGKWLRRGISYNEKSTFSINYFFLF